MKRNSWSKIQQRHKRTEVVRSADNPMDHLGFLTHRFLEVNFSVRSQNTLVRRMSAHSGLQASSHFGNSPIANAVTRPFPRSRGANSVFRRKPCCQSKQGSVSILRQSRSR